MKSKYQLFRVCVPAFAISLAASFLLVASASANTPSLSLINNNDGNTVTVNISGADPSSSVLLFYTETNVGSEVSSIGNTNSSGQLSISISSSQLGIAGGSSVAVSTGGIGGPRSNAATWPNVNINSSNGSGITLSPTSVSVGVGSSTSISASNFSGTLYLSNNSNPQAANVSISGSSINITGITAGNTTITICTTANSSTCGSVFVNVTNGSSSTSSLTFSQSTLTIAYGQSVQITISNGTGSYIVLNNSNSNAISTSISGQYITLNAIAQSGTSAITVCSSNESSCGIINATAGTTNSSSPISFSQYNPSVSVGLTTSVILSGDPNNSYYVSSNTNTSILQASVSANSLNLTGNSAGNAGVTVCTSGGSCGTLNVEVQYVASGGAFALSQTSISLLVGQVMSVTASGGTAPYSLVATSGSIFQSSLSGNIISITGIAPGSSSLTACSAGGACSQLNITVNASGAGTALSFSPNNLTLNVGNVSAVAISGAGGYYVSTSSAQSIASVQISGNSAVITALSVGNTNVSICQSGGQCAVLFVGVSSAGSNSNSLTFSNANPSVNIGSSIVETIYGGITSNYYVSTNTNPSAAQLTLNNGQLTIQGLATGSTVVVVCTSTTNCGSLSVNVSGTASAVAFATTSLPDATSGVNYSYQLSATGGSGSYAFSINSGALPSGLTLSSGGLISGMTTITGANSITINATDTSNNQSVAQNFTLNVDAASTTPIVSGTASYPSGELILENGTVYIVYLNTKVGFADADSFTGLGFSFSNVNSVSNSGLTVSSKVVVTADGAHPRGTWLIDNGAVFFLTPSGVIPVPDWNTFLNNGGQASFIVPANAFDLNFPTLGIMTMNDPRLHTTSPN